MFKKASLYHLLVLTAWFAFLFTLLLGGGFKTYLKKGYGIMLAGGLIILLALIINGIRKIREESEHPLTCTTSLGLFLFIIPILLAIAVRPSSLSTSAATSRGINTSLAGDDVNVLDALQSQIASQAAFKNLNLKQLLLLANREPEKIDGLQVSVEGFAYRDKTQPAGSFMLVRFLITCCAADATPLGVEVQSEENCVFPTDTWIRVQGTAMIENGKPVITQSHAVQVQKPSDVYLY